MNDAIPELLEKINHLRQKAESDDGPNERIECIDSTGQEGEPESEDQPAQRELVGDDVETCVGEGDSEEDREEEGAPQRLERESRVAEHARPYEPRRQLDGGVLQGDRLTACPATPAQQHVAQYGNVVIPTDWLSAFRTVRAGEHHGFVFWPAERTDVQERTDHQSDQAGQSRDDPGVREDVDQSATLPRVIRL